MLLEFYRLGWLIRFISHSVISGFTTSSAIVIALSQAKYFLGYSVTRSSKIIPLIKSIIEGAGNVCSFFFPLVFTWFLDLFLTLCVFVYDYFYLITVICIGSFMFHQILNDTQQNQTTIHYYIINLVHPCQLLVSYLMAPVI